VDVRIDRKDVRRGIRLFLILTVLGSAAVFFLLGSRETVAALRGFDLRWLAVATLLVGVDLLVGAARIHIFIGQIRPRSFRACWDANLANIFLAAATPFQTGGGAAQLLILRRYGIPYAAGAGASVLNFVATLVLLFAGALAALNHVGPRLPLAGLNTVLAASRVLFVIVLVLFLFFLATPGRAGRVGAWTLAGLARLFPGRREALLRARDRMNGFLEQYTGYLRFYWRRRPLAMVWNVVLTVALYSNKCLIAWVLLLGLGARPPFWEIFELQLAAIFFLYFAPTPGASLIAETGVSAILSLAVAAPLLPIFAVLWRFFTTWLGVLWGSVICLRAISEENAAVAKETEQVLEPARSSTRARAAG